jgi:predicted ATPase
VTTDAPPVRDRIVRIRFAGLRTAADVELDLDPMTVLIGANGVGKSTLIEGLEILRKVPLGRELMRALYDDHGGVSALVRRGGSELKLGVEITDDASRLAYDLILRASRDGFAVQHESLHQDGDLLFIRDGEDVRSTPALGMALNGTMDTNAPVLGMLFSTATRRMTNALAGIEIHVPFATQPRWFGPGLVPERSARTDNIVQAAGRVARGGANLANAFHALRNRSDWQDTLDTIKLVVDSDITDVTSPASASGGNIGLAVTYRTTGEIPAFALSDGTLALLALIALTRLDSELFPRSLLVLDEPDLHLHPGAIGQIVALLEACSATQPVVIATHSDRLLDSLAEPARATVLCDLDEQRQLRLRRPDRAQLERWLEDYRGLGQIRADGYDQLVFPTPRLAENA